MTGDHVSRDVEREVWDLLDADTAVDEHTTYAVAAALHSDAELQQQLGGESPAVARPGGSTTAEPDPLRAFVRSITVTGFRGIGASATVEVNPFPGITVISGRNGSGKSSFAEAMEFALTGASYRWIKKAAHWKESWRNLHDPHPAAISVDFAMEPDRDGERTGTVATVGVAWEADDGLESARRWSQVKGLKRESVGALGWDTPLAVHRPILSYDELGGLFEESPSALYDALHRLLGMDDLADAENRLKNAVKSFGVARKEAGDVRLALRRQLAGVDDPRAATVTKATARVPYKLDVVREATIGTATPQAATVAGLRRLGELAVPDRGEVERAAQALREALEESVSTADAALDAADRRSTLLREAVALHGHDGDGDCPVCGAGFLDDGWRTRVLADLEATDARLTAQRGVRQRLQQARTRVSELVGAFRAAAGVEGEEWAELASYERAAADLRALPDAVVDWPAHVESTVSAAVSAAAALRTRAQLRADELEDAWAPLAQRILAWVELETRARESDDALARAKDALTWLQRNAATLRERRLAPIVGQAREIWGSLRQESNVDLSTISLEGSANRRRAVLNGMVDGEPTGALSVMSQGELHALALALFIPRATAPISPFRFLVLDDPIQAMDPAKIGGLLDVLQELAKTRQVIVFSHDDRLPAAIRTASIPAQLLEVTRDEGSRVAVKATDSPAHRYIADAEAVLRDENLDDVVKRKAVPGLFRFAVEAAAQQRFYTERARAGVPHAESERRWEETRTTRQRVALSLTGDANDDIGAWRQHRAYRFPTIAICAGGAHGRTRSIEASAVTGLRKTVDDILEGR